MFWVTGLFTSGRIRSDGDTKWRMRRTSGGGVRVRATLVVWKSGRRLLGPFSFVTHFYSFTSTRAHAQFVSGSSDHPLSVFTSEMEHPSIHLYHYGIVFVFTQKAKRLAIAEKIELQEFNLCKHSICAVLSTSLNYACAQHHCCHLFLLPGLTDSSHIWLSDSVLELPHSFRASVARFL